MYEEGTMGFVIYTMYDKIASHITIFLGLYSISFYFPYPVLFSVYKLSAEKYC